MHLSEWEGKLVALAVFFLFILSLLCRIGTGTGLDWTRLDSGARRSCRLAVCLFFLFFGVYVCGLFSVSGFRFKRFWFTVHVFFFALRMQSVGYAGVWVGTS